MRKSAGKPLWLMCSAALAVIGLPGCGTTIKMGFVVTGSTVYETRADKPETFVATSASGEQIILTEGGDTSSLTRRQQWRVAGVDYRGHANLRIRKGTGGEYVLAYDFSVQDVIDGVWLDEEAAYEAEIEFVRGNWTDYQEGKAVEIALTPKGQQTANDEVARMMSEMISKGLQAKIRKPVTTTVERFTTDGVDRLSGDRRRIESRSAPVRISLRIRISR